MVFRRVRLARRSIFVDQQRIITAQRRVRALSAAVLATALRQSECYALVTRTPLRSIDLRGQKLKKNKSVNTFPVTLSMTILHECIITIILSYKTPYK